MKQKTYVEDIERALYDIRDADESVYKSDAGLTEEIIRDISAKKNDPAWMLDFRLKSLEIYNKISLPVWGPDISSLNMDEIITYVKPDAKQVSDWSEVPEEIKNTFDRLGIPEAEKKSLAGVGAQYDSEVVYHNIQENLTKQGVVYTDMETALVEHEDIVREYFMTLVPPKDHKFAALHGAVWSGGSFVYVPAGVKVEMPGLFSVGYEGFGSLADARRDAVVSYSDSGAEVLALNSVSADANGIIGKFTIDMLDVEVRYAFGDGAPYFSLYAGMGEEIGAQLTVADSENGVLAEGVYNSFDAETEEEKLAVVDLLISPDQTEVELPEGDWTELETEEEITQTAESIYRAISAAIGVAA